MGNTTVIIIPTYNEAENIPELVRRIRKAVGGVEVLIMDDSPNPDTANAAWRSGCKVIQRVEDKGLSKAVIAGMRWATSEKVIVMDADLSHPPELLPTMIGVLDQHDLVIASRNVKGGGVKDWSKARVLVSKVANLLALPIVPHIKDRTSGFFGFRRSIVNPDMLNPTGWKIALEVMAKGQYSSVVEVPFVFVPRAKGESKISQKIMVEYIKQLIPLYLRVRIFKFLVVGASGTVINLGVLYLLTDIVGWLYLVSYIPAFILSVGNNYLWNSLWTFKDKQAHAVGLGKYALVSTATLAVREVILYGLTGLLGIWYMASGVILIILGCLANFVLGKRFVWNKAKEIT